MITMIIGKEDLNVSMVSSIAYKLNAQAYNIINKVQMQKTRTLVACTGTFLESKLG
jgi:hypothetical protein